MGAAAKILSMVMDMASVWECGNQRICKEE